MDRSAIVRPMQSADAVIEALARAPDVIIPLVREVPASIV
jgi:hypothetical protein